MIEKHEMMKLLIEASPSFAANWEPNDYEGEALHYLDLGEYANYLVEMYRQQKTSDFPKIFDVIEQLHVNGDAYVQEAATIGLLEGIQIHAEGEGVDPRVFVPYLKKESLHWWNSLNDFWSGKTDYVGGPAKES